MNFLKVGRRFHFLGFSEEQKKSNPIVLIAKKNLPCPHLCLFIPMFQEHLEKCHMTAPTLRNKIQW